MAILNVYKVAVGKESSFKTKSGSMGPFPGRVQSVNVEFEQDELQIADVSSLFAFMDALHGAKNVKFTVEFFIQDFKWLFWIMGSETFTAGAPNTHDLSFSNSIPSLSMEMILIGASTQYSLECLGCKANSVEMTIASKAIPVVKMEFVAATISVQTSPSSVTPSSTTPFNFTQATSIVVNSVEYNSTCEKLVLSINRNLSPFYGFGEEADEIIEGQIETTLSLDIRVTDQKLYNLVLNKTTAAITHVLQRSTSDKATFSFSSTKYFSVSNASSGIGGPRVETLVARVIGSWTVQVLDNVGAYDS